MSPDFDWLLGNWARQNDPEGKKTFENWEKKTGQEYLGLGFTLEGQDTTWKETIRLVGESGSWRFEVSGEGGMASFEITTMDSMRFVCENPAHDFPQKSAIQGQETKFGQSFQEEIRKFPSYLAEFRMCRNRSIISSLSSNISHLSSCLLWKQA